jgi:Fe2+ transport system protein FeoA
MTLADMPLQAPGRIRGFHALTESELCRLGALGIREGAFITKLLRTPLRDPIECLVGPQLLALESWLLERIEVDPA